MQLNKEEARFISKWAKTKERGQWRYILTRGLLWGSAMAVLMPIIKALDSLLTWDMATVVDIYTSSDFFVRLVIFSAIGLGIYAYHWNFNSDRYKKLKSIQNRAHATANAI